MTTTATLNQVLELADGLPRNEQEVLLKTLKRRYEDAWTRQFLADTRQAAKDLRSGKLKPEPHGKMKARLRASLGPLDKE